MASGWWRVARKGRDKIQRRIGFTTEDTENAEKRGAAEQAAPEEDRAEKNPEMERMVMREGGTPPCFSYQGETKDLQAESLYQGEIKDLGDF